MGGRALAFIAHSGDAVIRSTRRGVRSGLLRHQREPRTNVTLAVVLCKAVIAFGELDLEGVLIQADALHTQESLGCAWSRGATSY